MYYKGVRIFDSHKWQGRTLQSEDFITRLHFVPGVSHIHINGFTWIDDLPGDYIRYFNYQIYLPHGCYILILADSTLEVISEDEFYTMCTI